jgi:hypothetical protein
MINISGYSFEGPYTNTASLAESAGVYAILTRALPSQSWTVIDIGESGQVRSRIESHDRKNCWSRNSQGTLAVAVLYTPGWTSSQRSALESSLREQYAPACGVV